MIATSKTSFKVSNLWKPWEPQILAPRIVMNPRSFWQKKHHLAGRCEADCNIRGWGRRPELARGPSGSSDRFDRWRSGSSIGAPQPTDPAIELSSANEASTNNGALEKKFSSFLLLGYGSIPINTIFSGMNIHLPAILMFTRVHGFWPIPTWSGLKRIEIAVSTVDPCWPQKWAD